MMTAVVAVFVCSFSSSSSSSCCCNLGKFIYNYRGHSRFCIVPLMRTVIQKSFRKEMECVQKQGSVCSVDHPVIIELLKFAGDARPGGPLPEGPPSALRLPAGAREMRPIMPLLCYTIRSK